MNKLILIFCLIFSTFANAETYFYSVAKWDGEARTRTDCINNTKICVGTKTKCSSWFKAPGIKTCKGWTTTCAKRGETCSEWATRVSRLRHDSGIELHHPTEKDLKKYAEEIVKAEAVALAIGAFAPGDPATKAKLVGAVRLAARERVAKDISKDLSVEWKDKTYWTDYK